MEGPTVDHRQYAPERIAYAMERYVKETNRLYGVLDRRLAGRDWIAGEYSIADMASYPWIVPWKRQQQDLEQFPHLKRWFGAMRARPAVALTRGVRRGRPARPSQRKERSCCLARQRRQPSRCRRRPRWPSAQRRVSRGPRRRFARLLQCACIGPNRGPRARAPLVSHRFRIRSRRRRDTQQTPRSTSMIKFYFNGSPNPTKIALALEEMGLAYEVIPVDTAPR